MKLTTTSAGHTYTISAASFDTAYGHKTAIRLTEDGKQIDREVYNTDDIPDLEGFFDALEWGIKYRYAKSIHATYVDTYLRCGCH